MPNVHSPSVRSSLRCRRALLLAPLAIALSGCQGITGVPIASQVRIIDASPDAPAIDIYQGPAPLAYNLALGTITSYVPVSSGASNILADLSGTHQHLLSTACAFSPGGQYTVVVGNYTSSLHQLILKDQTQPAPPGQVALRFLHQSTRAGALDLYLVPAGSTLLTTRPVLTSLAFNGNTVYFNLPAGTFTLIALPAGTVPTSAAATAYTGPAIAYSSGAARTVVLIDQPLAAKPGIEAVVANDFDPTAPTS